MKTRKNQDYPVVFAEDVFGEGGSVLADTLRAVTGAERPRVMLIADMNVVQRTDRLGTRIGRYVQDNGIELVGNPVVLAGGEKVKADDMRSATGVACAAVDARIGANDCILALGGGTILDVAGWCAAQVRGGVKIVRMPTTVAAMIDAAYADNAALDSENVKDAFRVPCRPAAVVIDTSFANTVLDGVWRAGYSEAIRVAAAYDASLAKRLFEGAERFAGRDPGVMADVIKAVVALRMKKGPTDFAQWSALRLEAMSGYKLPHGYAVAIGIVIDSAYSTLMGYMKDEDRQRIVAALEACGAMDGALHSRHLLGQADGVMRGLDAWRLTNGTGAISVLFGLGKSRVEENPDRETMKKAINMLK